MSVQVQLSGQLVVFAGQSVVSCEPADSVSALMQALVEQVPALREALFDEQGVWRVTTLVALNGQQVQDLDGAAVPDGAQGLLLMPMAGG